MKKTLIILSTALLILSGCSGFNQGKNDDQNLDNIYIQFIDKLEKQTHNKELPWDTVFKVKHGYDVHNFNHILETNEFRSIDDLKSYGLVLEDGLSVFLLNESIESGKDGSISDQMNLYLVKGIGDQSFLVPLEDSDISDLEESIQKDVDKKYLENIEYEVQKSIKFNDLAGTGFDDLIKEYMEKN